MVLSKLDDVKNHLELKNTKRVSELLESGILPNVTTGKLKKTFYTTTEILNCVKTLFENSGLTDSYPTFREYLQKGDIKGIKDLVSEKKEALVLSIANHKGGVSKTFTAIQLSWIFSKLFGLDVLIVDMDNQANTSYFFLDDDCEAYAEFENKEDWDGYFEENNISLLFEQLNKNNGKSKSITKDDVMKNIFAYQNIAMSFMPDYFDRVGEGSENIRLDILPSHLSLDMVLATSRSISFGHKQLDTILSKIKDEYDIILIDCPPALGIAMDMSIYASDKIILTTHPTSRGKLGLKNIISTVEALKKDVIKDIQIDSVLINAYNKVNVQSSVVNKIIKLAIDNNIDSNKIKMIPYKTLVQDTEENKIPLLETKKEKANALDLLSPLFEYCEEIFKDIGARNGK